MMPRDGGDPEYARARETSDDDPRTEHLIQIKVGDLVAGVIDARTIKGRAQWELETMRRTYDLLDWLERWAGLSRDERARLEDELGDMHPSALEELGTSIGTAMRRALTLPNASRRPSRSR